VMIVVKRCFI